jgi:hypothetical protein
LLGQVADKIGFTVNGHMNVIRWYAITKIRPELDFRRVSENRFKYDGFLAIRGFSETKTDINTQNFHFASHYRIAAHALKTI